MELLHLFVLRRVQHFDTRRRSSLFLMGLIQLNVLLVVGHSTCLKASNPRRVICMLVDVQLLCLVRSQIASFHVILILAIVRLLVFRLLILVFAALVLLLRVEVFSFRPL